MQKQPPPFIPLLYEMVMNEDHAKAIGFSQSGLCVELRDATVLSGCVLKKYFKHNNVQSFVRQLNNYGFKSIGPPNRPIPVFAHPCFQRDHIELLAHVKRKEAPKVPLTVPMLMRIVAANEDEMAGMRKQIEALKQKNKELEESMKLPDLDFT
jgi:hypothetical protein